MSDKPNDESFTLPDPVESIRPRRKVTPISIIRSKAQGRDNGLKARAQRIQYKSTDQKKVDIALGEEDWKNVYTVFAETGQRDEIARRTGLRVRDVNHLLNYGILRLGLAPIREHAIDRAEVGLRSHEAVQQIAAKSKLDDNNFLYNLPEYQAAVTNRVAREAAAAQSMLEISLRAGDVFLGFVDTLREKMIAEGPDAFAEPAKITPQLLSEVAKAANALSNTMDTAIQISRRTAGEPEQNMSQEITYIISLMADDELREYNRTGQLPHRILTGSGGSLLGLIADDTNPMNRDAIDVEYQESPGVGGVRPDADTAEGGGRSEAEDT